MNFYKNIEINYNYEEWRFNRLKSVIDNLDQSLLNNLLKLEDDKGILKVYSSSSLSNYQKLWINYIWKDNNEHIVKFIKIKEDNDDQFKYIDFNTNI